MTDDLQQLCAEWQERLALRDWTVQIAPALPYSMGRLERNAEVQYEIATRHARVRVLAAAEVDPDGIAPHDPEEALCHELLHLSLAFIDDPVNSPKGVALEQAINAIAHALVTLKREAKPA